jgi:hypothetical protein
MARPPALPAEKKVQIDFGRLSENSDVQVGNLDRMKRSGVIRSAACSREGCRGAYVSGGLSYCRAEGVVDQVSPASVRAAVYDVAC